MAGPAGLNGEQASLYWTVSVSTPSVSAQCAVGLTANQDCELAIADQLPTANCHLQTISLARPWPGSP